MHFASFMSNRVTLYVFLGALTLFLYLYAANNPHIYRTASEYVHSASSPAESHAESHPISHVQNNVIDLYLRTLADSLSGYALQTSGVDVNSQETPFNDLGRYYGTDWPKFGYTMIGIHRLDHLREALEEVMGVKAGGSTAVVEGDYLECGVWRGGASIFATGVLNAWSEPSREVHLCDSFQGLPQASTSADHNVWNQMHYLEVSLDTVQHHFERFHLLQDRVKFHRGYFQYSLPRVRQEMIDRKRKLAVLRLDGDMYESTMDELFNLYDLVSVGGIIIIDDWRDVAECRTAIREFLEMHGMEVHVVVDNDVAYWRKTADIGIKYDWYLNWNTTRNSV